MKKSSNNPSISVIMAVYNGMPYLQEAVKSILDQSYKDFEFIIVNDASTDGTLKYLKSLKDKRIQIINNPKNLGLALSLNRAIEKSKGAYIARMDADDISLTNRFKMQMEYLVANPKIDICGTWAKLIDENSRSIGEVHKPTNDKEIKKMNKWITGLIHPSWFGKKSVFEKLNGYNPKYDMVEDYEFLIRAKKFRMANLKEELLLWRTIRNRRSQNGIEKMYRKSLSVRLHYFKNGEFGLSYFPYLIRSLITTFLLPTRFKIFFNKKAGLL
ncbi:MAG: WbfO protein [uncultured bacterium]|nr:MAG: WbfO protein [uncultured bacterium]